MTLNILIIAFISAYYVHAQTVIKPTTILSERFTDKNGNVLTGKGVIIGDVDSGIDVFHPMFFFADGGTFRWIDTDNNKKLNTANDGIDLNENGTIDYNEIIRYIDIKDNTWGLLKELGANPGNYDPGFDFLYIDINGNRKRDFGPEAGFSESDPGYGEPLFIANDKNKNNIVEPDEELLMLKTSKIRAVLQRDGKIRRRGIDLIYCEADSNGHGTGVAGLIIGGHYGIQKIHGIAPDAEFVVSSIRYDYTPRFVRNFPQLFGFLRDEKVNILLIEDGEWMHEFMDGSSEEEQMLNEMARNGTVIIGGAGNLAQGNMYIRKNLKKESVNVFTAKCPQFSENKLNDGVFFTFLWKNSDAQIDFTVKTPDNKYTNVFSGGSGLEKAGNYNIYYSKEISGKGTAMLKLSCSTRDSTSVKGEWEISLTPSDDTEVRAFVVDISQSWDGTSRWINSEDITNTDNVCFPSTADSCIAVGAYVVNMGWMDIVGDLAVYSSRGYNITGKLGVDITAPGHSTFSTAVNNSWQIFSGTSSAAPHVVGAAALMLQYDPSLTHTDIRSILLSTAKKDKFTGSVPNPDWGWGKIDIEKAIRLLINNK